MASRANCCVLIELFFFNLIPNISKDGSSYKDDNKYFVNDVPKTLKDFNAYLDIDMNMFKMCSNINAFLNQKPVEMREYLFGLVGDVTDLDIVSQKAELAELVPLLNKYTVEELSAMNKATKAKITKDLPILDGENENDTQEVTVTASFDDKVDFDDIDNYEPAHKRTWQEDPFIVINLSY